jgi:hypothetical protein
VQLRIGRAWLRGFQIRAEDVGLVATGDLGAAHATVRQIEIQISRDAFLNHHRLAPEQIILSGGGLVWLPPATNAAPRRLTVVGLQTRLRFLPGNTWQLTELSGGLLGAEVHFTASITNAPALRSWVRGKRTGPVDWKARTDKLLEVLDQLSIGQRAVLRLELAGDGRAPEALRADLQFDAPKTSWNDTSLQAVHLRVWHRNAADAPLQVHLAAAHAAGDWGGLDRIDLSAQGAGALASKTFQDIQWQLKLASLRLHALTGLQLALIGHSKLSTNSELSFHTTLQAKADEIQTPWTLSRSNQVTLAADHGLHPAAPWQASWVLAAGPALSKWGEVQTVRLSGHGATRVPFTDWRAPDPSWSIWQKLDPFELSWECDVTGLNSPKLQVDTVRCAGKWETPEISIEELRGGLYGGQVEGAATLDVATREVHSRAALNFDVRKVSALLTPASQRWLAQFSWQTPPQVSAEVRVLLPPWTNARPQWREEVMPTIALAGQFAGSNGTFRGLPVAYARSHFTLTNLIWHLPDLLVKRPDADATLEYTGSMGTHDFRWRLDARVDPRALKPLLADAAAERLLEQFDFSVPPAVQGEVWGRWHEPDLLGFSGRLAATNFTFRGELVTELQGAVALTNAVLHVADLVIRNNTQEITVPTGSFDVTERVAYVTNAVSTMDPDLVTRVIGPKVHAALEPYRFEKPPTVRISGRLPTFDTEDADVHFAVAGEGFRYWRLYAPSLTGDVHWRGDSLLITNVQASFYGGDLIWHGQFDFSVPVGATLTFEGSVHNADLHNLMVDLGKKTNNLQGALDGQLAITAANSDDWRSWQGAGHVRLRDGFLWDIPIFGFFSPVLNTIVPGLGNSPISAADASFTIDQSVVQTSDLQLKSPALRLAYTGSVDFKGEVDARLRAEILRDAWGVGRVVSFMLWPISKAFEYQIKGSVYHPRSEPVYIPRVLLWALHPFKTIRKVFAPAQPPPPATAEAGLNSPFP